MNIANLAEVMTAGAAWTSVIITILIYLHSKRIKMFAELERNFQRLRDEFGRMVEINHLEHESQRKQINDIALTIANNYVRNSQLDGIVKTINDSLVEVRKEIGALGNRIDTLYHIPWRDR